MDETNLDHNLKGYDMQAPDPQKVKEIWEKVQQLLGEEIRPRIMVAGKSGVGKSSLLNAMLGKDVYEIGVLPTTRANLEGIWHSDSGEIVVIDVPGLGEADAPGLVGDDGKTQSYEENVRQLSDLHAHLLMLILKCDDRALELESTLLKSWRSHESIRQLPVITAINQIDKMKPAREWDPQRLNLRTPATDKEKNIRTYVDYVASLSAFEAPELHRHIVPVSAGECHDDPYQYGIENLRLKIYELLPDSAKTIFARAAELTLQEGERIVNYYSMACASAVASNFVPGSDAIVLAPIQIAMIVHLGKLHNIQVTKGVVAGLLSSLGLSFSGRFIFQSLISFLPFAKNLVGPPLAFGLTYNLGRVVSRLFSLGKTEASMEELKAYFREDKQEVQTAIERFKRVQ